MRCPVFTTLCDFVDKSHAFVSIDSLVNHLSEKLETMKSGASDYLSNLNKLQKTCVQAIAQLDEETAEMVKEIVEHRDHHVSTLFCGCIVIPELCCQRSILCSQLDQLLNIPPSIWCQKPPLYLPNLVGLTKDSCSKQNQINLGKENGIPLQWMVSCLPFHIIPWYI